MTSHELLPIILRAAAANGVGDATASSTPESMELDSLDTIEIIMAIEEEIGRDIPDEWILDEYKNKTFGELANLLHKKLEEGDDIIP